MRKNRFPRFIYVVSFALFFFFSFHMENQWKKASLLDYPLEKGLFDDSYSLTPELIDILGPAAVQASLTDCAVGTPTAFLLWCLRDAPALFDRVDMHDIINEVDSQASQLASLNTQTVIDATGGNEILVPAAGVHFQADDATGAFYVGEDNDADGDIDRGIKIYDNGTRGVIEPVPQGDVLDIIYTNFDRCTYDNEAGLEMDCKDPDAASPLLIYTFPNAAYQWRKSYHWEPNALTNDGTQCTNTSPIINSGPDLAVIQCADNAAGYTGGSFKLPDNFTGTTFGFTFSGLDLTSSSQVRDFSLEAMCRSSGDTINNTWSTPVMISITQTTAFVIVTSSTVTVTPNGTCQAGDWLIWRMVVDAAGGNTDADGYVLGVTAEYAVSSPSE